MPAAKINQCQLVYLSIIIHNEVVQADYIFKQWKSSFMQHMTHKYVCTHIP